MLCCCSKCGLTFNTVLEERVCHECWLDALPLDLRKPQKVKRKKPKRRRTRFEREYVV